VVTIGGPFHLVILSKFRCTAKDLTDPAVQGSPIWLRLETSTDDVNTWHQVEKISDHGFGIDASQPRVEALTIYFYSEMPDVVFNEDDDVEFAVPRPDGQEAPASPLVGDA
jgi:hypothetical protein